MFRILRYLSLLILFMGHSITSSEFDTLAKDQQVLAL